MNEGRIVKALAGFYYVEDGNQIIQCKARGKFRKQELKPLVGDYCKYEVEEGSDGYIMELLPRKNVLVRPPICNIDQALLVNSCKEPEFSTMLLDKFLLIIEHYQIKPIICITKMDLADDTINGYINSYRQAGYTVIPVSAKLNQGINEVKEIFKDKVTVFTGQSGVGKSSLLNALDLNLQIATSHISKALGRGRHTTRHVELLPLFGGYVADTPGFSSLELTMEPVDCAVAYHDFAQLSKECKFRGCLHDQEPHCAIKEAVANGSITKERYEHYLMYLEEVKKNKERQYG